MGTPAFAAEVLQAVLDSGAARVKAVYTQPDRPCGRGHKCLPSPVKQLALERGLPVMQPLNFKEQAAVDELAAFAPDVLLVAAYGLILPQNVLDIPRLGPWNVHASLLPRHRGAAPIQRSILAGDAETGITIMRMERGLDTGPMLLKRATPITLEDTGGSLHDRLARMGAELAVEALKLLENGPVAPEPQDDALATHAAKLSKDDTLIRWDRPVREVHDRIRAMSPKPGAYFHIDIPGENRCIRLQAHPGAFSQGDTQGSPPGRILGLSGEGLSIACFDGVYHVSQLTPAGKKRMDAAAFACGYLNRIDPTLPLSCPPPDDLLS
ncbi:Methionyl-tRNA formyltransferase [Fundidesulfovibrio magnetotacticus]|uniref:Methionyl-tRNA formyltransferase n=2 Tax=Fundidesulfovibrio magnetotacticus TaxID=2730080 RepID=A0A6V8LZA5_9BACT|nr:Methionyl-tRNA formyltransferase [Fundidesulfovibrio magnetotacticus]